MSSKKIVKRIKDAISKGSRSPSPEPGLSRTDDPPEWSPLKTPFTTFVLSALDQQDQKLVAMTFASQIKTDCDAKVLDFDDYFHLLGTEKRNALRVLNRTIEHNELVLLRSEQNSIGRPRDVYLLSVNQLEEVLLAANTDDGKKWRKLVLKIKNLVVQYMSEEMEMATKRAQQEIEEQATKLALAEQEKMSLATQLKNLRAAKSYLYAFWLFDDRYKCGITDNPEKREKQHNTSCPSGRMVHTVVIACKQSEKLLDSIMKKHGNHVKQEEYEIEGGEAKIRLILNTIARVEETLHSISFDRYDELLAFANDVLETDNRNEGTVTERLTGNRSSGREDSVGRIERVGTYPASELDDSGRNRVELWLLAKLRDGSLPDKMLSDDVVSSIEKMFPRCGIEVPFAKRALTAIPGIRYGTPTVDKVKGRGLYFKRSFIAQHYVDLGLMTDPVCDVDGSDEDEE